MAGSVGGIQNFVIKHREVESKTQADLAKQKVRTIHDKRKVGETRRGGRDSYRMCGWEFCDGDIGSGFVGFEGFICTVFAFVAEGEFCEITMIISFPKKKLAFTAAKRSCETK